MSNRNKRIKPIEVALRKEIKELEDEVLELQEDNSKLRLLIEDRDKETIKYIKQGFEEVSKELAEQQKAQETLRKNLDSEKLLRRRMDNGLREEIAAVGTKIRVASHTWLGKYIFK